jgi:hypothetical protein
MRRMVLATVLLLYACFFLALGIIIIVRSFQGIGHHTYLFAGLDLILITFLVICGILLIKKEFALKNK